MEQLLYMLKKRKRYHLRLTLLFAASAALSLTIFIARFFIMTRTSTFFAHKHFNAHNTCNPDNAIDKTAKHRGIPPEQPSHQIKLEKAPKPPIQSTNYS
jgi:hypothetical protein